ncbi:TPA: hypothetical protein ACH3X1_015499 [Trebouxia sp. C0004]
MSRCLGRWVGYSRRLTGTHILGHHAEVFLKPVAEAVSLALKQAVFVLLLIYLVPFSSVLCKHHLADMLKMYGYHVQLRPMPLGYAGTIYNCNLTMLQDLGLQRTVAKGVLKKLHTQAILCLHNIIKERR